MTSCLVSASIASIAVDVERRRSSSASPHRLGRLVRHHAELGHRVQRMRLDLEPDPEARLRLPEGGHGGAGIARNHWNSFGGSARA